MRLNIPNLLPGTDYAIQVRANDGEAVGEWSRRFLITTNTDQTLPSTPTGLTWVPVGNAFHGEWNVVTTNVSGDTVPIVRYEIELVANAVRKVVSIPQNTDDTKLPFDLSWSRNRALFGTAQKSITIRVRAVDTRGLKSAWSSSVNADMGAPGPVTGLTATGGVENIELKWTPPTDKDVASYNIYVSTTSNSFTGNGSTLIGSSRTNSYTYLTTNTVPHYFIVRAVDTFGYESVDARASATPKSSTGADATGPTYPGSVSLVLTTNEATQRASMKVSWTQTLPVPNDLAGFHIRYRAVGDTDWQIVTVDAEARSVVIDNLRAYVNYEVQIQSFDFSFNESGFIPTVTTTDAALNTAPSTPAAPTVATNTMQIQVSHNNTKASGGTMDPDTTHYEVYASSTTGFTANSTNLLGTMRVGPAISAVFPVPATGSTNQTWYVKVIAVDAGGLKSAASAEAQGTVGLISNTNIADATITSAKITSLEANKITAGSGLVNDMIVKSKLTLGDANSDGLIASYDYVSGVSGFQLGRDHLEINKGTIRAGALHIQQSPNMMPPEYADFEFAPEFYTGKLFGAASSGGSVGSCTVTPTSAAKYNTQCLYINHSVAGATNPYYEAILSSNNTSNGDNIIGLEEGKTYIISCYAWVASTSNNNLVRFVLDHALGGFYATGQSTGTNVTAGGGWTRISGTYTMPVGAGDKANLRIRVMNAGAMYIDGVQIEEKISAADTPSSYSQPGTSRVDGGIIRTGEIRSNNTVLVNGVAQPLWSINLTGGAQFGSASVRGTLTVGSSGDPDAGASYIQSGNYVANSTGWRINSAGNAFLNEATVRGTITTINGAENISLNTDGLGVALTLKNQSRVYPGKIKAEGGTIDITPPSDSSTQQSLIQVSTGGGVLVRGAGLDVVSQINARNGINFNHGARSLFKVDFGTISTTVNASGIVTIPHDLGDVPVFAIATNTTQAACHVNLDAVTATNAQYRLRKTDGTGTLAGGTSVALRWIAIA